MDQKKKTRLISMRLTEAQFLYLESMMTRVQAVTGMRITRTSIILKLLEYGLPALEKDFPRREHRPSQPQDPHEEQFRRKEA